MLLLYDINQGREIFLSTSKVVNAFPEISEGMVPGEEQSEAILFPLITFAL